MAVEWMGMLRLGLGTFPALSLTRQGRGAFEASVLSAFGRGLARDHDARDRCLGHTLATDEGFAFHASSGHAPCLDVNFDAQLISRNDRLAEAGLFDTRKKKQLGF